MKSIINPFLFALAYIVLISPAGMIARLVGWDPLRLRRPPLGASLWRPRPPLR